MFQLDKYQSDGGRRQRLIFCGLLILLALPPIGACLTLDFPDMEGPPHPPDVEMLDNFHRHKENFERLRQMILEDKGLTRIDANWTNPSAPKTVGVTAERIALYRELFQKLGAPRGFSASLDGKRIEIIASARGWVAGGSSKCYVWLMDPPENVFDDLDSMSQQDRPIGVGYRKIEGRWYLHFYGD